LSIYEFKDLFILDLANNHQGDVKHGLNIIREHTGVLKKHGVRGGIKFQFRQLDTFIHPAHHKESDNKHIPRFLATRMDRDQYQILFDEVKKQNCVTICTPFDEESVDIIVDMGFDIIKVASCSATDWPLLEKISESGLPVIFSTGGLTISQVDDLVSFFGHKAIDFAIMHCVSIYPTPHEKCNIANITMLRLRNPKYTIGWSTHENPDDILPVVTAIGQGAEMYERHIGLNTDSYKLNAYSSTPEQIDAWIAATRTARKLCGSFERQLPDPIETESIDSLRRGVYAKSSIKNGDEIPSDQVYFAMPYIDGQVSSGMWKAGGTASTDIRVDEPVLSDNIQMPPPPKFQIIKTAVHEVKALLSQAMVHLGSEFVVEYSHHQGLADFTKVGAVIITCINREYCKKILVQLPGQKHPEHFHRRKEETFQVLWGEMNCVIDGHHRILRPGETALVLPGIWHHFWTETGCVFEEVSSTHFKNDSVYRDQKINHMELEERKTIVDHWGTYQI